MKAEILRVKFDEQIRGQKRKESSIAVEGKPAAGLRPWREVVTPHPDVASGRYQQAEFAADLWQVFLGEGSDEYRDPVEFYRRTFITEGLQKLLSNALLRMAGQGGDPVVELQTNFGGGKTHSMLALYHLFANVPAIQLPGMEAVTKIAGVSQPPKVRRAVLVGNRISPADIHKKADGTVVRTLWGELAWQLGAKEGYEMVRTADRELAIDRVWIIEQRQQLLRVSDFLHLNFVPSLNRALVVPSDFPVAECVILQCRSTRDGFNARFRSTKRFDSLCSKTAARTGRVSGPSM